MAEFSAALKKDPVNKRIVSTAKRLRDEDDYDEDESSGYGVNSYSSQFVLKSIRTHFGQFVLSFRSIRTHVIKFSQLVLILVDSYSVWSIRTHTRNMILMILS